MSAAQLNQRPWSVQLDRQDKGALRTELTFRRETDPPKPVPWKLIGAVGALAVAGIAIFAVLAALGIGSETSETAKDEPATQSPASTDPSVSAAGTEPATPNEPSSGTDAPESPIDEVLTIQNNADLKNLLKPDDDYSLNQAFARKYRGREIRFDGSVADATPGYYLVYFGDDSDTNATSGPAFQFRVQALQAGGEPVVTGDNLRFTAVVGAFNADQGLFFLDPLKVARR